MVKRRRLDFEIDKLTNSIENVRTGEIFETDILRLGKKNETALRQLKWNFNWIAELQEQNRGVHALAMKINPTVWQGLVSSEDLDDHIYLHLLESAPFNKGRDKVYAGVAANLVAFLCKTSFEKGYHGNVVFEPQTRLIEHYEKALGAKRITRNRMFIDSREAYKLVTQYFPEFDNDRP